MSMKRNGASLALAIVLFGCAPTPTPDTAIMPLTGAGTPQMSDTGAIGLASYVLGSPSRYDGHPADAARALAAVDYLAGALYANPHWVGIPAESKLRMLQARTEVLDGLMAAANALAGDDTAAARAALPSSVFGLGPDRTIALLNNLPPLPAADAAAQYLNYDTMTNCSFTANCG
jgi:hypothetical protein